MNLQTSNSRQINVNVMDGNNQMAAMFASFRPGKSLNLNLEIINDEYAAEHFDEIADAFDAFAADAVTQARACGVPVNAPVQPLANAAGGAGEYADAGGLSPA